MLACNKCMRYFPDWPMRPWPGIRRQGLDAGTIGRRPPSSRFSSLPFNLFLSLCRALAECRRKWPPTESDQTVLAPRSVPSTQYLQRPGIDVRSALACPIPREFRKPDPLFDPRLQTLVRVIAWSFPFPARVPFLGRPFHVSVGWSGTTH